MNHRERMRRALNHEPADRVPVDLGSNLATGIHGGTYTRMKKELGLPESITKINEPFQFLAEVENPVREALGIDTLGLWPPKTMFGYRNENWKPFSLGDGTTVFVSGNMEWDVLENGDIVLYPQGNRNAEPSGKMPKDGSFFDAIVRQEPIDEEKLDPKAFAEQTFQLYTDEELRELEKASISAYKDTEYALVGSFLGASFSRMTETMGPYILNPTGIRDPEEWLVSLLIRKEYVMEIHNYQYEIGMKNLAMYKQAMGDRLDVVVMSGTDFGMQNGPLLGVEIYRELIKPFHEKMNGWVHQNTNWKTFFHTCGSVREFLDDFYAAGVDILNPVQISAAGMVPRELKENYGDKFVFWGGGVDTQNILPFASEDEVRAHVRELLEVFTPGGGYVFSTVHNIQDKVPVENVLAAFDEVHNFSLIDAGQSN